MKKTYILLLIIISILLSSCMKVDTKITINNQFNIDQEIIYDYTITNDTIRQQIKEAKEEARTNTGVVLIEKKDKYIIERNSNSGSISFSSSSTINKIKNPCLDFDNKIEDLKKKGVLNYKDISCRNLDKTNDKILTSYKGGSILKYVYLEDGDYKINLFNILGEEETQNDKKQTKEEKEKTLQMLKSMGYESNYLIIFPSKIVKSDIGKIDNKKLTLSISDFLETEIDNPTVIIKKLDIMPEIIKKDNIINVYLENKKLLTKELILSRNNLSKSFSQKKYINLIDKIVEKLSENPKKLQKLYKKLEKINTTDKKYRKVIDIIIYLKAKTGLKLYELKEK